MRKTAAIIWIGFGGPVDSYVRIALESWGGDELMEVGTVAAVPELFLRQLGRCLIRLAHRSNYGSLQPGI